MNAEAVLRKAEAWRLSSRLVMQAKEKAIEALLLLAALTSVAITIGIVGVLVYESIGFFRQVSLWEFFSDRQWTPLFADAHYGILPLVSGTLVTTAVALFVAVPIGRVTAVYLSEYASRGFGRYEAALELLSAVPTVVYGYFALLFVTPVLQKMLPGLPGFNMLSAGLVIGIMIVPYISSISEDAMRAVPCMFAKVRMPWGPPASRRPFAPLFLLPSRGLPPHMSWEFPVQSGKRWSSPSPRACSPR